MTLCLVTVGSTSFDALLSTLDTEENKEVLLALGIQRLFIQRGRGSFVPSLLLDSRWSVEVVDFVPQLDSLIDASALVIAHGGAGTTTEVLRKGKPLVVVTNDALMDGHQAELACRLAQDALILQTSCAQLHTTLKSRLPAFYRKKRVPLGPPRADLLLREIGHVEGPSLLVLGSGGHTAELLALIDPASPGGAALQRDLEPAVFVAATTDRGSEAALMRVIPDANLLRVPRSREVLQSYITSVFTTLWAILACIPLVFRVKPRTIVVNGPGTCLPLVLVAHALAFLRLTPCCETIFIESAARVSSLSLTGKLLLKLGLCTRLIVQWPDINTRGTTLLPLTFHNRI